MDEQTDGHRRGPRAGQILGQMYTQTNRYIDGHGKDEQNNRKNDNLFDKQMDS